MTTIARSIDADLHAAWLLRRAAWNQLCDKDTPAHRDAYLHTCDLVDAILDRINEQR